MLLSDLSASLLSGFVAALFLLTFVSALLIAFRTNRRKTENLRRSAQRIGRVYEAYLGPFINSLGEWHLVVERAGGRLLVRVADVAGVPDAQALDHLPEILNQLPQFESQARHLASSVSPEHSLEAVLPCRAELASPTPQFKLRFTRPESASQVDEDGEQADVVDVAFRGGNAVSWTRVSRSVSTPDDGGLLGRTMPLAPRQIPPTWAPR
jgi:hypothetical protein